MPSNVNAFLAEIGALPPSRGQRRTQLEEFLQTHPEGSLLYRDGQIFCFENGEVIDTIRDGRNRNVIIQMDRDVMQRIDPEFYLGNRNPAMGSVAAGTGLTIAFESGARGSNNNNNNNNNNNGNNNG